MKIARLVVVGGIGALQLLSCSSDPPPVCPTGDCSLPGSTIVKWTFDHYPEFGFSSDTCIDMGADRVSVTATLMTDATVTATMDAQCGEGQISFIDLPAGMYTMAVTPIDVNAVPIVKTAVTGQVMAGVSGLNTEVTVNVPWDDWTNAVDGTFLFRIQWAGVSCESATPPVQTQTLKLDSRGTLITKRTDGNQKMDGTDEKPCRKLSEPFAQYVESVPFGPATLTITGKDQNDKVQFERTFDTFIGATKNNPTITFDVTAPPADAGVDAPLD